jgi:hypothetical protein
MIIMEPAMIPKDEEFRRSADECRVQAEQSVNLSDKERWLKLAENWLIMARDAERDEATREL